MVCEKKHAFFIAYTSVLLSGCVVILATTLALLREGRMRQQTQYMKFLTQIDSYGIEHIVIPEAAWAYRCGVEQGVIPTTPYAIHKKVCLRYALYELV